jgi:hypothetical protein
VSQTNEEEAMAVETSPILDTFRYRERDMFVYRMLTGEVRAFYRSLHGTSGKQSGKIYPFDGIARNGWIIKDRYYHDSAWRALNPRDENYGYAGADAEGLKRAARDIEERAKQWDRKFEDLGITEANRLLRSYGAVLDPRAA